MARMKEAQFSSIIRKEFPALERLNFLDSANQSLLPFSTLEKTREVLNWLAGLSSDISDFRSKLSTTCDQCRNEAASMINSDASEIALIENTTFGMNLAIHLIDQVAGLNRGDNVVVPDIDFLGIPVSLYGKVKLGAQIKWVKTVNGRVNAESICESLDKTTKAVMLSSVQESNGFRVDLTRLSRALHEKNILLAIDAIQHVGAMKFDAKKFDVDFAFLGGHKWLNAPFGVGLFYCNKKHLDHVSPLIYGYRNLKIPGGLRNYIQKPKRLPLLSPKFVRDARKLEVGGTFNFLGVTGLHNSLRQKNAIGMTNIENKIHVLCDELIDELQRMNVGIQSHVSDKKERSGIISFRLNRSVNKDRALVRKLVKRRNIVSFRMNLSSGGIRVSPHFFNESADIQGFIRTLKELYVQN